MPESLLIPFDSGQHEGIDQRLLPPNFFAKVENGQLDRDGRIRSRRGYTAIAATTYGTGAMVAYDLFSYNDRLCALGDRLGKGFPTDVFEYTLGPAGTLTAAAAWRPTVPDLDGSMRLPRATGVRDVGSPPEQEGGTNCFGCAASAGFVTLVYNASTTLEGFAHVFRASTDQTIAFRRFPGTGNEPFSNLKAIALSAKVWVLGIRQDFGAISATPFTYATDEAFNTTVANIMVQSTSAYNAAKVAGSDEFVVVTVSTTGTMTLRRFDSTATLIVPSGGQYATKAFGAGVTNYISVEADSVSNTITVAAIVSSQVRIHTYNLSTGADIAGPLEPTQVDTKTCVRCEVVRRTASTVTICTDVTSDTEPTLYFDDLNPTTSAFTNDDRLRDAQMASCPIEHSGEIVVAIRYGAANLHLGPNLLLSFGHGTQDNVVTPLIGKDLETADSSSTLVPSLVLDSSTGLYYWANATISGGEARPGSVNDSIDALPLVTEFRLGSSARRQVAQLGNLAYIAGGCPTTFDGRLLGETGYHARPRIISITPSNGAGALLSEAEYDYKLVWEAVDCDRNVVKSSVSAISTVTMGASDDTNALVCATPHSMRCNVGVYPTGGSVRLKAYRTRATVTRTAATVTSLGSIDPPSGALTGLTLRIVSNLGGLDVVTFSAAATTAAQILAEINAVTGADVVATLDGGVLRLTTAATGATAIVLVQRTGTANLILGFSTTADTFGNGTTTFTKGENFQLCAVAHIGPNSRTGLYVTLTDVLSDDDLKEQELVYTSVESPIGHHAPPPFDYVWSGRERLSAAGLPRRDRWVNSKLLDPFQPCNFAPDGLVGFNGRLVGDIQAVVVDDEASIYFTRRQVWRVSGSGPARNGQGEFFAADQVATKGLKADGWRSICKCDEGTFFQLDDSKLYILRPGGAPEWIGQPVRDTLERFPVITAAVYVTGQESVVFAAQNTGGSDGALLVFDLRRKTWRVDTVGAVTSMAEFDGRIAYIQGGVVYLENTLPGVGAFVPIRIDLEFNANGALSWGTIHKLVLLGVYRGDCNLEVQISYNDGRTWTTCGNFDCLSTTYAVGDPVELEFAPAVNKGSRFAFRILETFAGTNSEGVWLNAVDLQHTRDTGTARKGSAFTR